MNKKNTLYPIEFSDMSDYPHSGNGIIDLRRVVDRGYVAKKESFLNLERSIVNPGGNITPVGSH